jgi:DNA-binding transcriptional LysR family regulator
MRTFAQVVDEGSFAAAARRTSMNQAVVTRLVADLEAHLGARLQNRTTRSLSLTEAGERYLQRCRQILADIGAAEEVAGDGARRVGGRVRLALPLIVGIEMLAPRLPRFREQHPDIVLDIALFDRPVDLVAEGFDIALMPSMFNLPNSLVARSLGKSPMVLCASPSYLRNVRLPVQPEDLLEHACVGHSLHSLPEPWKLSDSQGHTANVPVNFVMNANNLALVIHAVRAGVGIGQQVKYFLEAEFSDGRLVPILPGWQTGSVELSLVYPSREYMPRRVRAAIDFIVDFMDDKTRAAAARAERKQPAFDTASDSDE